MRKAATFLSAFVALALTLSACSSSDDAADDTLLADFGLDDKTAVEIVDYLERLDGPDRPQDLRASVRVDELQLQTEEAALNLPLPDDRFYFSFAPFIDMTHECFYHSLTTCQGELRGEQVDVTIIDNATGEVLVDEIATSFDNGFIAYWLPKDIEATLTVSFDGHSAETVIATDADSPTCLTSVQLT